MQKSLAAVYPGIKSVIQVLISLNVSSCESYLFLMMVYQRQYLLCLIPSMVTWLTCVQAEAPPIIDKNVQGVIAAFGDFDSDKMTDVFLIHPNGRSFSILKGYKSEPLLRINKKWNCVLPESIPSDENIVTIMLADFHGMALMDMLLVTKGSDSFYSLYLVQGSKDALSCSSLSNLLGQKLKTQPLLLDINGDMIADVVGIGSAADNRTVWQFGFNATIESHPIFGSGSIKDEAGAFVDLNRDTMSDVFIAGDSFEYWFLGPSGYTDHISINRPADYKILGHSSFVDIDSDGKIDHILPACRDWYCVSPVILLLDDNKKWIEIDTDFQADTKDDKYSYYWDKDPVIQKLVFPITLRTADFNGDGYSDFVTLMKSSSASDPVVVVLMNVPSNKSLHFTRGFKTWTAPSPLKPPYRPLVASFFDLYEDGRPDILMSAMNKDKPEDVILSVIVNSVMVDACFLKVMLASGLCYDDCSGVKGPNSTPTFEPGDKDALGIGVPYGTNTPGAHLCHELMDTEGYRKVGCQGQLTQSSHFSLQMPYTIFGLGSTPNFVEILNASIPGPNTSVIRSRAWTSIVPDAQVVLIPYPIEYPGQWRSKLYYTPSDIVLSTLITLASICIILIIVIAFLHRKEILEDIAEHEEYKRHWPDSR